MNAFEISKNYHGWKEKADRLATGDRKVNCRSELFQMLLKEIQSPLPGLLG